MILVACGAPVEMMAVVLDSLGDNWLTFHSHSRREHGGRYFIVSHAMVVSCVTAFSTVDTQALSLNVIVWS